MKVNKFKQLGSLEIGLGRRVEFFGKTLTTRTQLRLLLGGRLFREKAWQKASPEIIWWCSHIVVLHRKDFKQSLTAIVLQVRFKSFIIKSLQYTRNTVEDIF